MAYSLNDPYRPYRYVLRVNALLCGLGLGLLLLGQPHWATDLLGWPHAPAGPVAGAAGRPPAWPAWACCSWTWPPNR